MISLPEEFELIGFFESEPTLASPDSPWRYNNLRFELSRDKDKVICEIEPAYGELKLLWQQGGIPRVNLKLNNLASLSIHITKGDEHMIVSGSSNEQPTTILKLRLKPFVAIELGCWHETA